MRAMYDRNAPAKLFHWPADNGEETVYPTLDDALRAAGEDGLANAWIITQAGDILNPRMIAELRLDIEPGRERRAGPLGLIGWACRAERRP